MNPIRWPEPYTSAATLSFDVDACAEEMLYYGNVSGAFSAGDYGPKAGIPRILELLERFDIKATFHVPGWVAQRFPKCIKDIHAGGHEIAAHGYMHENISRLRPAEEKQIHHKAHRILADLTGQAPVGFRTPGGPLTPRTVGMLLEMGYVYDSSSNADYFPSRVSIDGKAVEMAELPWSWILDDFPFFWGGGDPEAFFPLSSPDEALSCWTAEFDSIHRRGGLCMLVNHPRCIGRPARMRVLAQYMRHVMRTPGVWLTTQREVAAWVLKEVPAA